MLKVDECAARLEAAELALESAPQTGFVDLDKVKEAITGTRECLRLIMPRLELGEKLAAQVRQSLLAKLNVLRNSGGGDLLGQAEEYLKSGNLEFERLTRLHNEIEKSLDLIFGNFSRNQNNRPKTTGDPLGKAGDYR